jgi:hypothetical protein
VTVFAALWIVGLLAATLSPVAGIGWESFAVIATASVALFMGERAVGARSEPEDGPTAVPTGAARWYWAATALAVVGASMKFAASYEFAGGEIDVMLASNLLRGAVTSGGVEFSPLATALTSCMYVAAALTGFLCQRRIQARYVTHFVAVGIDSFAISGRGSFLIVALITIAGLGVAWRGSRRRVALVLGATAVSVVVLVVGLSFVMGRDDVGETLFEYVVAPLFGLDGYLRQDPPTGIHGPTLLAALTAKFGGDAYDAGDFIVSRPFVLNVSSGFREVLSDLGAAGLLLFGPIGAATVFAHRLFRRRGGWAPYATAVSLYAYLGYFYYVSLGAFLAGWWAIFLSAPGAMVVAWARTRAASAARPGASTRDDGSRTPVGK